MATTQRTRRKPRRNRRVTVVRTDGEPQAIRWSKVIAAQARIASGHYDRDEVREELVDEVLRELRRS